MTSRSLVSPKFSPISMPRIALPSKRALFHIGQLAMVLGYVVLCLHPLDGDAMLLGLACQMVTLSLYAVSRTASKTPLST